MPSVSLPSILAQSGLPTLTAAAVGVAECQGVSVRVHPLSLCRSRWVVLLGDGTECKSLQAAGWQCSVDVILLTVSVEGWSHLSSDISHIIFSS